MILDKESKVCYFCEHPYNSVIEALIWGAEFSDMCIKHKHRTMTETVDIMKERSK